jgi:hypothetical protein
MHVAAAQPLFNWNPADGIQMELLLHSMTSYMSQVSVTIAAFLSGFSAASQLSVYKLTWPLTCLMETITWHSPMEAVYHSVMEMVFCTWTVFQYMTSASLLRV